MTGLVRQLVEYWFPPEDESFKIKILVKNAKYDDHQWFSFVKITNDTFQLFITENSASSTWNQEFIR
jgi:hypothetical protein